MILKFKISQINFTIKKYKKQINHQDNKIKIIFFNKEKTNKRINK